MIGKGEYGESHLAAPLSPILSLSRRPTSGPKTKISSVSYVACGPAATPFSTGTVRLTSAPSADADAEADADADARAAARPAAATLADTGLAPGALTGARIGGKGPAPAPAAAATAALPTVFNAAIVLGSSKGG